MCNMKPQTIGVKQETISVSGNCFAEDMHIVHIRSPPGLQNMHNIVVCCDAFIGMYFCTGFVVNYAFFVICIALAVMFFFYIYFCPINLFIHNFRFVPFYIF